jgi:hypothetical protein
MNTEWNYLRRYTELPQAIELLKSRSLTLLDPQHWDDKNDAVLIEKYRKMRGLEKILALCFTEASETYHHWKIYARGVAGVCIEFHKERLLDSIPRGRGFRHGPVKYIRVDELASYQKSASKWPFLKRLPFSGEKEYRLIYEDKEEGENTACHVNFELKAINHIYLSPWVHKQTAAAVANMIRYLPQCGDLNVTKTTLVSNRKWSQTLKV